WRQTSPGPTRLRSASQATWPETWTASPSGVGTTVTWAKPYPRLSNNPAGTRKDRLMAAPHLAARTYHRVAIFGRLISGQDGRRQHPDRHHTHRCAPARRARRAVAQRGPPAPPRGRP